MGKGKKAKKGSTYENSGFFLPGLCNTSAAKSVVSRFFQRLRVRLYGERENGKELRFGI
jgi:hypothetical protein